MVRIVPHQIVVIEEIDVGPNWGKNLPGGTVLRAEKKDKSVVITWRKGDWMVKRLRGDLLSRYLRWKDATFPKMPEIQEKKAAKDDKIMFWVDRCREFLKELNKDPDSEEKFLDLLLASENLLRESARVGLTVGSAPAPVEGMEDAYAVMKVMDS